MTLAWGAKVSPEFRARVLHMAVRLRVNPSWLMAIMAFETGRTFSPSARNAQSGATGLIQFMPGTARELNTTVEALAAMSAVEQLDYVERYFARYAATTADTLASWYMVVLWPAARDDPDDATLFASGTIAYAQNRALDVNNDGKVTKAEAASFVARLLTEGMQEGNATEEAMRTDTPQPAGPTGTQPHQREDQRMAPLAIFSTLLPTVLGMFAPKAQQAIQRATGTDPEVSAQFVQQLFQQIGTAVGVPVTDDKSAVQAVGKLTEAPAPTVQKVEDDALAYLDRMAPLLAKISELDRAARGASDDSHDRAATRNNTPEGWKLRWAQVTFTQKALAVTALIAAALIAVMTVSLIWLPADTRAAVLNLIGQLVIVLVTTIGLLGATFRDQNGFSFGGTVDSNAAAMARDELAARRKGP